MKENKELLDYGIDLLADKGHRGTPAGNARFTQEQLERLKVLNIPLDAVTSRMVKLMHRASPFTAAPPDVAARMTDEYWADCPIISHNNDVSFLILPNGRHFEIPR